MRWNGRLVSTLLVLLPVVAALSACGRKPHKGRVELPPDLIAFERLMKSNDCANKVNRLYVIDNYLVFWRWEGTCNDASHGYTLYGGTPDEVLALQHDSIAGPRRETRNPGYLFMFETILAHIDEPQLGLAPDHIVRDVTPRR